MLPPPPEPAPAAGELSLRVSVATLVRVLFYRPQTGTRMLALERKATVEEAAEDGAAPRVTVRAQPLGGAIRFRRHEGLPAQLGEFQFDSERSRAEADFRILIRPSAWDTVRQFCLEHLADAADPLLDADPARELAEELADALGIDLRPGQYQARPVRTVVVDQPAPSHNRRALGQATARIYQIYEAQIVDATLAWVMLANSERYTDEDLARLAVANLRRGGRGRSSALLALPLEHLTATYQALAPAARAAPLSVAGHVLDGNVAALLI